jgi:hypothetical protein
LIAVVVIEAAAIALLGLLMAGLLRSHAEILRRLHELNNTAVGIEASHPPEMPTRVDGTPAADLVGETPVGEVAAIAVTDVKHNTLLAFLSSNCSTCAAFWAAMRGRQELGLPPDTRLVVVTKSAAEESLSQIQRLTDDALTVIMSTEAWTDYGIPGSPYFILVDGRSGQVVGEGSASRWSDVRDLMMQAIDDARALQERGSKTDQADRHERIEAELRAAGIGPGHPALYGYMDTASDSPGSAKRP